MTKKQFWSIVSTSALMLTCSLPGSASAYIGPGAGLSAIGAFLAIVASLIAAIFGFIWYPLKRILRKKKCGNSGSSS
jgi:hypothetical protein